jgi:hypothetical protein
VRRRIEGCCGLWRRRWSRDGGKVRRWKGCYDRLEDLWIEKLSGLSMQLQMQARVG